MTDKALVLDAVQKLPDSSTLSEVQERIEFIAAVQEGMRQVERGDVVSLDEVEGKIEAWATR